ncbi:hypothetical protein CB0940_08225 [Cercospora beticola]|uniref:Rhodopsin domain-containing protein n=1 Tax=Cercospora beticola TaxID=122368 RepID=A0A2G5HR91_CERBT|nr:hypothetical protein CB0940_08225 [Cercospora beticola]PIA94803.1 hypothetical protein CB0940_08225 [Cercospora beticola]WPB04793.1 hypothetical protein RHO25_009440 [Cercospora beticola]
MSELSQSDGPSTPVEDRGPVFLAISITLFLVATAFYVARVAWRAQNRLEQRQVWREDLMLSIAWTAILIQTILGGMAVHHGFGKHKTDIPSPSSVSVSLEYIYLYWICFILLGTFTKLSFCCLYLRVFTGHRKIKSIVKLVLLFTITSGIAFTLGTVWQCVPIQATWKNWDVHQEPVAGGNVPECIDKTAFFYSHASFNTGLDLLIYALPLFAVHALPKARPNRFGLFTIFGLGAFVIAASIARMAFLKDSTWNTDDPTWDGMPALTWMAIESSFAMIICCLPVLGPLLSGKLRKAMAGLIPASSRGRRPSAHDWYDFSGVNHGSNPGLGRFTNIHASPNASPLNSSYDLSATPKPNSKIVSRIKGSLTSCSRSSASSDDLRSPARVYHPPKIELGEMYRPQSSITHITDLRQNNASPVWKHTARMHKNQQETPSRKLNTGVEARDARPRPPQGGTGDLAEFLRAGPQAPADGESASVGYVGKGKGQERPRWSEDDTVDLADFLREGPQIATGGRG